MAGQLAARTRALVSRLPLVRSRDALPVDVLPALRLGGKLTLPGDKSISHRALMLALLAEGETRITGAGDGEDVRSTAGIVTALGADVLRTRRPDRNVDYVVVSRGARRVRFAGDLWCGNSGTTMRLVAGILAGLDVNANLDGDASLERRPMSRVVEPLRAMGADIEAGQPDGTGGLAVTGPRPLRAIDWTTPVASAQVKSSILLAALAAQGTTVVRQPVPTRDHTERMLRARGVPVRSRVEADGSSTVELDGPATVRAVDQVVPGDPSAAAFWLVAGSIHPDAELRIRGVGVNPTRRAAIDLLRRMGASIEEDGVGAEGDGDGVGEPIADLVVRSAALEGIEVSPAETAAAIDEIPVLCLAATQARGRSVIRGAGELRHKESDRIAGIVDGLGRLGARITADGDDLVVDGPVRLCGGTVDSLGDHRLAMTFAVAGLVATDRTTIQDADSVGISYPGFFADLERIRS
ncbi:MAG TPA: 3-phosphoshikimate 1-carboxyvinyltransferase [Candidatus Binatia bacterium]|nr:3-phosphoshikimate 1-carboxyvinyltransferase [Candidatus Binatia bacterium]